MSTAEKLGHFLPQTCAQAGGNSCHAPTDQVGSNKPRKSLGCLGGGDRVGAESGGDAQPCPALSSETDGCLIV